MKLSLFKKVCLTVMGVGVVSSLVSVGTFASFTATATNPTNTFAAGKLTLTDAATGTDSNASACAGVIASCCGQVIKYSTLHAAGLRPGQFLTGQIAITNPAGNLPASVAVQIQNASNTACTGTDNSSAAV